MIIHIPIEIYETGDYKIHDNRSVMHMEVCEELPPVNGPHHDSVLDVLAEMLLPTMNEKIKWNASSSGKEEDEDEEEDEEDEEEDEEDDEEEEEEKENEEKENEEEKDEKKEEEIKIYMHEIKPKNHKKENNIMTFKKRPLLKDNFTRKIRFHPETFVPIFTD
jgi:hypothetical protein